MVPIPHFLQRTKGSVSESMLSSLPPFELADDARSIAPRRDLSTRNTRPRSGPGRLGSVLRCIRCLLDGWKCTWIRVTGGFSTRVDSVPISARLGARQAALLAGTQECGDRYVVREGIGLLVGP